MEITMAGIDYRHADIDTRQAFAFTGQEVTAILQDIKKYDLIDGCVIIHTCNRTELWLSGSGKNAFESLSPTDILCSAAGQDRQYSGCFFERSGEQAVRYLFELASGLHSQVFGDDQIITQVKESLENARQNETVDTVLEVLFRSAVTAAKRVKSSLQIKAVDKSAADAAVSFLKKQGISFLGVPCLVIGNGEIGQRCAVSLLEQGADVTVTLRKHKGRAAVVPAGCRAVRYDDRYLAYSQSEVIISATRSPHCTITKEQAERYSTGRKTLIDLAIPRDIEPGIADIPEIACYDIDSLPSENETYRQDVRNRAWEILQEYYEEFIQWESFRKWVAPIQQISRDFGKENARRLEKPLQKLDIPQEQRKYLQKMIRSASGKTLSKLLYGLRGNLDEQQLAAVIKIFYERLEER